MSKVDNNILNETNLIGVGFKIGFVLCVCQDLWYVNRYCSRGVFTVDLELLVNMILHGCVGVRLFRL